MIYADNNATTSLKSSVQDYLIQRIKENKFYNPNSLHAGGLKQKKIIEQARQICADELGARADQVIFTSGSTESLSTIVYSVFKYICIEKDKNQKDITLLSSKIEHSSVYQNIKELELTKYLELNDQGESVLSDKIVDFENIDFGCLMAVNNETGVIQPWERFVKKCLENKIISIVDTTQWIGKKDFDFNKSEIDFASLSGHKIGALIGSGIILAKDPSMLKPLLKGGGQESNIRSGTQNFLAIETLAIALRENKKSIDCYSKLVEHTRVFEEKLRDAIPNVIIFGSKCERIPGTTLLSIPGLLAQAIVIELEAKNIFVSTSSACSDNDPETSRVLKAMNVSNEIGRGVLRISLCSQQGKAEYDKILSELILIYKKLKKINWK